MTFFTFGPMLTGAAALLVVTVSATDATAQEDASPPPSETATSDAAEEENRPKMDLSVAPPGPALQRRAYVHEGFYLRVNVGPGYMYTAVNSEGAAGPDVEGHAFALGADVLVGGSPSPGMALGGGITTNLGFGTDFQDDGTSLGSGTVFHFIAGPFFDAFPNDKQGFHLGLTLGAAGMLQSSSIPGVADSAFGGGGGGMIGYDMWVAEEWSAGFELRATGAYMAGDGADAGIFSVVGLVTILNH